MKRFISVISVAALLISLITADVFAAGIEKTVFENGALSGGTEWITERTEVSADGNLAISTGNYFQPGYVYADEFLPVTADTRDSFAVKLKVKKAAMSGYIPYYNVFLVADYYRESDQRHMLMFIETKEGWTYLENDAGKDYKEITVPFSEFKDKGRVCCGSKDYDWDGDSNPIGGADEGYRLADVDWSQIYAGVGLEGVRYEVGVEKYGLYLHYGTVEYDDVKFVNLSAPSAKIYPVNGDGEKIETADGTVPVNGGICVEFNSDFTDTREEIENSISLADEEGNAVSADVEKANGRKYIISPKSELEYGKTYKITIGQLTDISGNVYSNPDGFTFTAGKGIRILAVPENLSVSEVTRDSAQLSWDAVPEETDGYVIYRDGTEIALVSGTSYFDGDLMPSGKYSYQVASYADGVRSKPCTAVYADTLEYKAPENFGASYIGSSEIELRWDYTDAKYYEVYSGSAKTGEYTKNSAKISGLTPDSSYSFRICAVNENSAGNKYRSDFENVTVMTAGQTAGSLASVIYGGEISSGFLPAAWTTGANPTTYGKSSAAGINGESNAFEMFFENYSGVNFIGSSNIPYSANLSDGGFFMYVKQANKTDNGTVGLAIKSNSEESVMFNIDYDEWTPVFIPFSAYHAKGASSDFNTFYISGFSSGGHRLLIDCLKAVSMTPRVEQCYILRNGLVESEPCRETSNMIRVKFSAPMDEKSLSGIKVYINDVLYSDYKLSYGKSDFTADISFDRQFEYDSRIKITVPESVKSESCYSTPKELPENMDNLTADVMTEGICMAEEYSHTFTIRDNPLPAKAEYIIENGKARGTAVISNFGKTKQNVMLICIVYSKEADGRIRFKNYSAKTVEIPGETADFQAQTDEIVCSAGDTVQCFVWDNINDMHLLSGE